MENNIFLQISMLLGVTVSIAFIVKLMRQPLMVAYIIAGILSGPLFFNLMSGDTHMFEAFAQFGIVLLLFVLGLNLNFSHLKSIGKVAVITGIGQVLFTFVVGSLILLALGMDTITSIYLALAITFSSTIIIIKLLSDKKKEDSVYGKYTIGLMLVQDVIAILILVILGSLSGGGELVNSILGLLGKGIVLAIVLYSISRFILPRLLDRVASHGELLFIFTITWCFAVASLINLSGFSIEIGAVAAGMMLGSSPYQKGIISRIKPLRDFFIMLFFVILGSEMSLANFGEVLVPGIILSAFILVGNPIILYVLYRTLKFTRRNSFLAGITAAQVSEFGFILIFTGQATGLMNENALPIFTLVALITIFISSYLITYGEKIFDFLQPVFHLFGKDRHIQKNERAKKYDVWVFGYHRVGWKVCEALKKKNIDFAVVDLDPKSIKYLKSQGIPAFFGDVSDVDFLEMLPLERSKMIISTLPDPDTQITFISYVKEINKKVYIIAHLDHNMHVKDLYDAGADYIFLPHVLGGVWIYDMLMKKDWTKKNFSKLRENQEKEIKKRRITLSASER